MKNLLFLFAAMMLVVACNNPTTQTDQAAADTQEVSVPEGTIEIAIIDVTGMHCEGCESTITNVLAELEGVESAKVSLEYEQAKVKFNPVKVSTDDLKAAIESKGYGVANVEVVKEQDQRKEATEQ